MDKICIAVINSRSLEIESKIETLNTIERVKDPQAEPATTISYIHAQIEKSILDSELTELKDIIDKGYNVGSQGLRIADLLIADSAILVGENVARVNEKSSPETINAWFNAFAD
jgi:hypothetical protein